MTIVAVCNCINASKKLKNIVHVLRKGNCHFIIAQGRKMRFAQLNTAPKCNFEFKTLFTITASRSKQVNYR